MADPTEVFVIRHKTREDIANELNNHIGYTEYSADDDRITSSWGRDYAQVIDGMQEDYIADGNWTRYLNRRANARTYLNAQILGPTKAISLPTTNSALGYGAGNNATAISTFGLDAGATLPASFAMGIRCKFVAGMTQGTWSYALGMSPAITPNEFSGEFIAIGINSNTVDRYKPFVQITGGARNYTSNFSCTPDQWFNLAIRVNSDNLSFWINGVAEVSDVGNTVDISTPAFNGLKNIWIGCANPLGTGSSNVDSRGSFKDAWFAPVAVSNAEMLELHNRTKTPAEIGATWWVGLNGINDVNNKITPAAGTLILAGSGGNAPVTDTNGPY